MPVLCGHTGRQPQHLVRRGYAGRGAGGDLQREGETRRGRDTAQILRGKPRKVRGSHRSGHGAEPKPEHSRRQGVPEEVPPQHRRVQRLPQSRLRQATGGRALRLGGQTAPVRRMAQSHREHTEPLQQELAADRVQHRRTEGRTGGRLAALRGQQGRLSMPEMDADLVRYPTGTAQGLLGHGADPASGRQVLGQAPPRRPVELQVLPRAHHRRTYAQEAHTEGEGRAKARQRTGEQPRQEGGDV